MGLFGKEKIPAKDAAELFLESLSQMLSEYWPRMSEKVSVSIGIPIEHLNTDEAFGNLYLALVSIHYHDISKLFNEKVAESLRRNIWYSIKMEESRLGDILRGYCQAMDKAEEDGELYLSVAASLLYEKLGGENIISNGTLRIASPTATMALTELLMVFDLEWWNQLKVKFKIVP